METFDVYQGYKSFYVYYDFTQDTTIPGSEIHNEIPDYQVIIKLWYWAITTLSTIGYGDLSPKSALEKFIGSIVLLLGVAVFSIIMNNLMDIMREIRQLDAIGAPRDLSKWIAMLSKYNNGLPMNKEVI